MKDDGYDECSSEFWKAIRKSRQQKRSENRESSLVYLKERSITFIEKNDGAHLIVYGTEGLIDFWPGTGRWRTRKGNQTGFGVRNLVDLCKIIQTHQS